MKTHLSSQLKTMRKLTLEEHQFRYVPPFFKLPTPISIQGCDYTHLRIFDRNLKQKVFFYLGVNKKIDYRTRMSWNSLQISCNMEPYQENFSSLHADRTCQRLASFCSQATARTRVESGIATLLQKKSERDRKINL